MPNRDNFISLVDSLFMVFVRLKLLKLNFLFISKSYQFLCELVENEKTRKKSSVADQIQRFLQVSCLKI